LAKVVRAEPIAALYEKRWAHHLGAFPDLEDQLCGFTTAFDRKTAGYSPGRLDAMVWAATELTEPMAGYGIYHIYRRAALQIDRPSPLDRPAIIDRASTAPEAAAPDNRVDWRRRFDELASRRRTGHPEESLSKEDIANAQHINGPKAKTEFARGCLEYEG
jgi:hypothetical protein